VRPLHDGYPATQLRRRDGGLLPAWTGTYDEQVEIVHAPSVPVTPVQRKGDYRRLGCRSRAGRIAPDRFGQESAAAAMAE